MNCRPDDNSTTALVAPSLGVAVDADAIVVVVVVVVVGVGVVVDVDPVGGGPGGRRRPGGGPGGRRIRSRDADIPPNTTKPHGTPHQSNDDSSTLRLTTSTRARHPRAV